MIAKKFFRQRIFLKLFELKNSIHYSLIWVFYVWKCLTDIKEEKEGYYDSLFILLLITVTVKILEFAGKRIF